MKYSIGLDIGTTSIGWAIIDEDNKRIEKVGVRIFEKPENPKDGKSLSETRRTARSTRRRLKRRRQRLNFIKKFFRDNNLLTKEQIEELLRPENKLNPYKIREKALNEKISNEELFISLYHIAKRRGYKSNRKSAEEKDKEGSKVLSAISKNEKLLKEYKTVASALNSNEKFIAHKRNKAEDYSNSFVRANFEDEAKLILKTQKEFGLNLSDEKINFLLFGNEKEGNFNGIFSQRPFMTSELIMKMRGKCSLEKSELRAPKASYSFEMFRLAENLAHLRVVINNEERSLTEEEISKVIEKAKDIKVLKYQHIREVLGYKKDENFSFPANMIRGEIKKDSKNNGEENKFGELSFYHKVKTALSNTPEDWQKVCDDNYRMLDELGEILSCNKDDESLRKEISKLGLSEKAVEVLMTINVSGFGHLSFKALRKIFPFLLKGDIYSDALKNAGYDVKQQLSGDKNKLPPLSKEDSAQITNPVVKRAVSQTIKVVNAIIREYGAPYQIKIEAASDLAKNFKERKKIKKAQDENASYNERIKERLQNEFNVPSPTGLQITKFKLYEQQNGKCAYSGKRLVLENLFSNEHYAEIDHIIPFSRCGNDSLINKVLVLTEENRQKGNLTPFEAWGADESRWAEYEARVNSMNLPFRKKGRLLAKVPPKEDWNSRALNDTRYISKFLGRYLRKNLKFAKFDNENPAQRVIVPNGSITSYLRRVWRVGSKNREENNLHHATDACVIAAIDQNVIQKISRLNKYFELFKYSAEDEVVDKITGEISSRADFEQTFEDIEPWKDFGKEVRKRTAHYESPIELHNELIGLENYDEDFRNRTTPIFVSRMPKRSGKGNINKETIRSPKIVEGYVDSKEKPVIARKQRIRLTSVDLKTLYDSPVRETDPVLYEILKARLNEFGDKPEKAFGDPSNPVYKPTKNGSQGNIVRSIKVYDTLNSKSGFLINKGKAFVNNGDTIRLDVFKRKNYKGEFEYYFSPIYVHLLNAKKVEILPTPNGRSAAEKADFNKIRDENGKIFATEENGFVKQFSLYPNDYVRIYAGNRIVEGYYVKYGITDGTLNLMNHDQTSKDNLSLKHIGRGTITFIERYDISVLGDNYRWI